MVSFSALLSKSDLMAPVRYCGRNSIIIYLAFFLPMATSRAALLSLGVVHDLGAVSLIVTAIAEGRKCARIVNRDLGGSPMDADREMLAVGAWSGEADRTLRHEAEAAGTVRPWEEFFSGPGTRRQ